MLEQPVTDDLRKPAGRSPADLIPAGALALLAAAGYLMASLRLDPRLADTRTANLWFDSDIPYRLESMAQPGGWYNGGAHPLFPTIAHVLRVGSMVLTGHSADPMRSARIVFPAVGGVWVGAMYVLFRQMKLTRLDATLFAAIGAVSSGALFWFPVPETFGLAAAGTTLALVVAASPRPAPLSLAVAGAASASCILTNGVVGFLAVLTHNWRPRQWGRAITALLAALGLMTGIWAFQEWSLTTPFFLGDRLLEYRQHCFPVTLERTTQVIPALVSHSMVAPRLRNERPSFRTMGIASSGPLSSIAVAAWLALLLVGSVRLVQATRSRKTPELAITAAGGLVAMLLMHLTLGREPFLYAMNVLPLLLVVAASSAGPEQGRTLVRALACVLLLSGALNNARQFVRATDAARAVAAERVGAVRP